MTRGRAALERADRPPRRVGPRWQRRIDDQRAHEQLKIRFAQTLEINQEEFVDIYPMLPEHIELIMKITSALQRSRHSQATTMRSAVSYSCSASCSADTASPTPSSASWSPSTKSSTCRARPSTPTSSRRSPGFGAFARRASTSSPPAVPMPSRCSSCYKVTRKTAESRQIAGWSPPASTRTYATATTIYCANSSARRCRTSSATPGALAARSRISVAWPVFHGAYPRPAAFQSSSREKRRQSWWIFDCADGRPGLRRLGLPQQRIQFQSPADLEIAEALLERRAAEARLDVCIDPCARGRERHPSPSPPHSPRLGCVDRSH
jgi:hypothetical protein